MNVIRGPWTETGANFDPNLAIVREAVRNHIAKEIKICKKVGVIISELEIDAIEDGLWNGGHLEPGAHIQRAYPGLLEETAGSTLDRYYSAA